MEETEKELTEAKQKLAELQAQSEARQEPQKTLTLDEAISFAGNSPREEPEFVDMWAQQDIFLAAKLILKRAGLSDEDFTLEQLATFAGKCNEKISGFYKDGKLKYPEKVDMTKATLKTLKKLETIMRDARQIIKAKKAEESENELSEFLKERTALLKIFWLSNDEFSVWEQTLVMNYVAAFKANLGKN